jgi:hypothetical protein
MVCLVAGSIILCSLYTFVDDQNIEKDWWDYPKIAIAYGGFSVENESNDGFKLLRLAGVTALVGGTSPDSMVQHAEKEGIRLIGLGYAWGIPHSIPSCRSAVNEKGQITTAACPFSEPFWEGTIRRPVLETAKQSLKFPNIVGFFVDSEQYALYPNLSVCFCENCWRNFLDYKGIKEVNIDIKDYSLWLVQNGYLKGRELRENEEPSKYPKAPFTGEYIDWVIERFTEQYRKLAKETHTINPKFVFGKLPEDPHFWYDIAMMKGTATEEAPFFILREGTYACAPSYGSKPERGGWDPNFKSVREELDKYNMPYRLLGGIWLTVDTKEKADKRYTRDVFQLYDQAHRLGSPKDSDGYWFGPVGQIISQSYYREHYPGNDLREYWLALRSINRFLGIPVPDSEYDVLNHLRKIDD